MPGRGGQPCAELLELLAERDWTGNVVVEVNTRRARPRASARPTWPRRSPSPGSTWRAGPSRERSPAEAPPQRRAAAAGRRPAGEDPAATSSRPPGSSSRPRVRRRRTLRGDRPGGRGRPGAGAPLLRGQGRAVRRRPRAAGQARASRGAGRSPAARTASGERLVRFFLAVWDTPEGRERVGRLLRCGGDQRGRRPRMLREFLTARDLRPLVAALGHRRRRAAGARSPPRR